MIKVNFTPKTDIEEYLNNDFNLGIFEDLTENEDRQGIFEPLDFLNLLYEQFEIVNANKEKPLSVVKHLFGLKLEPIKLYYLLYYLNEHIYEHSGSEYEPKDKQLSICRGFIEKEYDKLEAELYPKTEPEPQPEKENKYDFQKVKQHIETLTTVKDKILYLTEIKTDFLQNESSWEPRWISDKPFDLLCELEIKKLEKLLELEQSTPAQKDTALSKVNSAFTLSKALSKIDYIRIINALSELRCFQNDDGTYPAKKEVMKAFGNLANIDLSNYDKDLNKAFTASATLEANLSVFDKMKEKTQEIYLSKLNKPQK